MARSESTVVEDAKLTFLSSLQACGFERQRSHWRYSTDGLVWLVASFKKIDDEFDGPGEDGIWEFRGPNMSALPVMGGSVAAFMPSTYHLGRSRRFVLREQAERMTGLVIEVGSWLHVEIFRGKAAESALLVFRDEFCMTIHRFAQTSASKEGFLSLVRNPRPFVEEYSHPFLVNRPERIERRLEQLCGDAGGMRTQRTATLFDDLERDDPNWVCVEERDKVIFISFSDRAARDHEDVVAATLDLVAALPGVENVRQEDRDLILAQGASLDLRSLADAIRTWWRQRLSS